MPKKNPLSRLKKYITGFVPFQILLSIVGLLLMAWGVSRDDQIRIAVGGALFGAAISNLFAAVMESDLTEKIEDILNTHLEEIKDIPKTSLEGITNILTTSLSTGMRSDNNRLPTYRTEWYYYYVTQMDGVEFWRLVKFDFSYNQSVGKLTSRLGLRNKAGDLEYYSVEGAIRDGSLIIAFEPKDKSREPDMINVFPLQGGDPYFGMLYLMTWDRNLAFSPCIISRKPLTYIVDWVTEQDKIPEEFAQQLDTYWANEFKKANKILRTIYKNLE